MDTTPSEAQVEEAKQWIDNNMSGGGSWNDAQGLAVEFLRRDAISRGLRPDVGAAAVGDFKAMTLDEIADCHVEFNLRQVPTVETVGRLLSTIDLMRKSNAGLGEKPGPYETATSLNGTVRAFDGSGITQSGRTPSAAPNASNPPRSELPRTTPNLQVGRYLHFKGDYYLLLAIAETHQHIGDWDAVYIVLRTGKFCTRPLYFDSREQAAWQSSVVWPDGVARSRFILEGVLGDDELQKLSTLWAEGSL